MIGLPRILGYLQRAVNHELGAARQYTLQAACAENLGLRALAQKLRRDTRQELEHAEAFSARMLRLGAAPRAGLSSVPRLGRTALEILQDGLATELLAVRLYGEASRYCSSIGDGDNHALFARILADEVRHYRELERQLEALGAARAGR
jgi:bacterioferritin